MLYVQPYKPLAKAKGHMDSLDHFNETALDEACRIAIETEAETESNDSVIQRGILLALIAIGSTLDRMEKKR